MPTALFLIAIGVLCRLLSSPWVFGVPYIVAPLGVLSIYAASRLPRVWAFAVPVAILALSDVLIDARHGFMFWGTVRLTTYAVFVLAVALAQTVRRDAGIPVHAAMSIGAATAFFLISNLVVWATGTGLGRPLTLPGLMTTYADGLPFYGRQLVAEMVGVALLFGVLDSVVARSHAVEKAEAVK